MVLLRLSGVRACLKFIISPANPTFWNFAAFVFSLIALLFPQKYHCETLKSVVFGLKAQNLNKR